MPPKNNPPAEDKDKPLGPETGSGPEGGAPQTGTPPVVTPVADPNTLTMTDLVDLVKSLTVQVQSLTVQLSQRPSNAEIKAPAGVYVQAPEDFEDGECDPVTYFSPIAEMRFSLSVGGKIKDSKGNLIDPQPETFEFHGGVMVLRTKFRVWLAENYGPYSASPLPTRFYRTTARAPQEVAQYAQEVAQYAQGVTTTTSAKQEQRR